jgi:hypothetical protein
VPVPALEGGQEAAIFFGALHDVLRVLQVLGDGLLGVGSGSRGGHGPGGG